MESESSTTTVSDTSSTSTATTSSDEFSTSSDEPTSTKAAKKKLKPNQLLAKKAAKKNDKKSKRSILEHVEIAQQVTSEKVGSEMEKELQRLEKKIAVWKEKDVEIHSVQRFVARIMKKVTSLNIVVGCDHAIFVQEMGLVRLLEMDLSGTMDRYPEGVNLQVMRNRANELFHLTFDSNIDSRLEQTRNGTAWLMRDQTGSLSTPSIIDNLSDLGKNIH